MAANDMGRRILLARRMMLWRVSSPTKPAFAVVRSLSVTLPKQSPIAAVLERWGI